MYESVVVKCKAETGLRADKSFHRTEIIKLTILSMDGKAKDERVKTAIGARRGDAGWPKSGE